MSPSGASNALDRERQGRLPRLGYVALSGLRIKCGANRYNNFLKPWKGDTNRPMTSSWVYCFLHVSTALEGRHKIIRKTGTE